MPIIQVFGIDIDAEVLVEQVLALAEQAEVEPLDTAAGDDGEGAEAEAGGGSHYDDSFGELIAGLIKQGIIGETELGFSLTGSDGAEFVVEAEFLSEGYLLNGGGFGPLGVGTSDAPDLLTPTGGGPSAAGGSPPPPDLAAPPRSVCTTWTSSPTRRTATCRFRTS